MNERRLPGMTIAVFAVAAVVAVLANAAPGVATVGNAEIVGKARFTLLTDCYADTAMTGFLVCNDTRIFNCAYFNNWSFKMDNPTVFRHEKGNLIVTGGRFSKNSPKATLYSSGKGAGCLVWHDNNVLAFTGADKKGLYDKLKSGSKADDKAQKLAD